MSVNQLLYSASAKDSQTWKSLGLNNLHVKSLTVNSHPLKFDKIDITVPVNTYNSSDVLVGTNVFQLNIHAVNVGSIVILTIAAIAYTVPSTFSYFSFQLPTIDFAPNIPNAGLLLASINLVNEVNRFQIMNTGQVRIYKSVITADFSAAEIFAQQQQTITYDTTN